MTNALNLAASKTDDSAQQAEKAHKRIMVIKLGALGDFIQALGPMSAIRHHHPDAHITLLTTKLFTDFGRQCGYFDDIWIDERPRWADIAGWISLRKRLNEGRFDRVYDLQNNDRTSIYLRLFKSGNRPEWVGAAKGASHRNDSPLRSAGHAFDGHVQTLGLAGIHDVTVDDMAWVQSDIARFDLPRPFVLLVPGAAPTRPEKRWPAERYGELANRLDEKGFCPVVLGTRHEKDIAEKLCQICPAAKNLTEQTNLFDIVALGRAASGAIGNDSGPMHMIGPTGCPSLVLFSGHSNPQKHAPRGDAVRTIQEKNLKDIVVDRVWEALTPETFFRL